MNDPFLTFQCVLGDGSATPVREYVDVTVAVEPNVEINAFGTVATVRGKLDHFYIMASGGLYSDIYITTHSAY